MSCFQEFTYAMHADGELSPEEAARVDRHLEECAACRSLVEALTGENVLFAQALAEAAPAPTGRAAPAPARRPAGIGAGLRTAAGFAAAATVLGAGAQALGAYRLPESLQWLDPFRLVGLTGLAIDSTLYIMKEGEAMVDASMAQMSGLVLLGLLGSGFAALTRRKTAATITAGMLAALLVLGGSAPMVHAQEEDAGHAHSHDHGHGKHGGGTIVIPADEVVDETAFYAGESIRILGTVEGDVYAFGNHIIIEGKVDGNLFAIGESIELSGEVDGSAWLGGERVSVSGEVGRTAYTLGDTVTIAGEGQVGRDVLFFGKILHLDGKAGRDLKACGETIRLGGEVERDVEFKGGVVHLSSTSVVGGDLDVEIGSEESLNVEEGAVIRGETRTEIGSHGSREPSHGKTIGGVIAWQVACIAGAFLVGLLGFILFPGMYGSRIDSGGRFLKSAGLGFLVLTATPIAAIILLVTVLGIPIGLMGLGAWLAGLYLAHIVVAASLGQAMLGPAEGQKGRFALRLLIGLVVLAILTNLPFSIGGWVGFVVTLTGLGALATAVFRRRPAVGTLGVEGI